METSHVGRDREDAIAGTERAQSLKRTILQFNGGEVRLLGAKLEKQAHDEICSLFPKLGERINSSEIVERRILDPASALDI